MRRIRKISLTAHHRNVSGAVRKPAFALSGEHDALAVNTVDWRGGLDVWQLLASPAARGTAVRWVVRTAGDPDRRPCLPGSPRGRRRRSRGPRVRGAGRARRADATAFLRSLAAADDAAEAQYGSAQSNPLSQSLVHSPKVAPALEDASTKMRSPPEPEKARVLQRGVVSPLECTDGPGEAAKGALGWLLDKATRRNRKAAGQEGSRRFDSSTARTWGGRRRRAP